MREGRVVLVEGKNVVGMRDEHTSLQSGCKIHSLHLNLKLAVDMVASTNSTSQYSQIFIVEDAKVDTLCYNRHALLLHHYSTSMIV
jgi:hypothetical protein